METKTTWLEIWSQAYRRGQTRVAAKCIYMGWHDALPRALQSLENQSVVIEADITFEAEGEPHFTNFYATAVVEPDLSNAFPAVTGKAPVLCRVCEIYPADASPDLCHACVPSAPAETCH